MKHDLMEKGSLDDVGFFDDDDDDNGITKQEWNKTP
jgi:hypothetical protein